MGEKFLHRKSLILSGLILLLVSSGYSLEFSDNFNDDNLDQVWIEPTYLDSGDDNSGCSTSSTYPFWSESNSQVVSDQNNCDFGGIYYSDAYVYPEYFSADLKIDDQYSSGGLIVGYNGGNTNQPYYRIRYGYDEIYISGENNASVTGTTSASLSDDTSFHNVEFQANNQGDFNISVDGTAYLQGEINKEDVTGYTGFYSENTMYFDNFYLSTDNSTSICDRRGSENECIVDSEKDISGQDESIDSVFISESSAIFNSPSGQAKVSVSNSSFISGLWFGEFNISSNHITLRPGASFRPDNRIILEDGR